LAEVAVGHIDVDEGGEARVAGTGFKVLDLVLDRRLSGDQPEDIIGRYPGLTLAQLYAAFAYHAGHRQELDERAAQRHDDLRAIRQRIDLHRRLVREEHDRQVVENREAYERCREQVKQDYAGKYVVFGGGRVLSAHGGFDEAVAASNEARLHGRFAWVFRGDSEPAFEPVESVSVEFV
jgi:uncharacterized protein (DUF433 family)